MGISLRAARNAYHSGRTSIRKDSGEVYSLEWRKPVAPIDTSKCYYCHRDLTVKDRSTWFHGAKRHQTSSYDLHISVHGFKGNRNIKQRIEECL